MHISAGLSTTQFIVLGLIGKAQAAAESCTISGIAADLDPDPATVVRTEEGRSSLLDGLEEFVQVGLRTQEIHPEEEL